MKVPEPEFEGQTKNRLGNPEVRAIVDSVLNEELVKVFEWHPKVGGLYHIVSYLKRQDFDVINVRKTPSRRGAGRVMDVSARSQISRHLPKHLFKKEARYTLHVKSPPSFACAIVSM